MKFLGLWLIRAYQRFISPLYGPVCKYSPSCSHFTYQAIARHGLIAGCVMGFLRICRCNPWALGGPDPVPQKIRWTWRGPVRAGPPALYDFGAVWAAHAHTCHDQKGPTPAITGGSNGPAVLVLQAAAVSHAASERATIASGGSNGPAVLVLQAAAVSHAASERATIASSNRQRIAP